VEQNKILKIEGKLKISNKGEDLLNEIIEHFDGIRIDFVSCRNDYKSD
jgi:hypothetical protein